MNKYDFTLILAEPIVLKETELGVPGRFIRRLGIPEDHAKDIRRAVDRCPH